MSSSNSSRSSDNLADEGHGKLEIEIGKCGVLKLNVFYLIVSLISLIPAISLAVKINDLLYYVDLYDLSYGFNIKAVLISITTTIFLFSFLNFIASCYFLRFASKIRMEGSYPEPNVRIRRIAFVYLGLISSLFMAGFITLTVFMTIQYEKFDSAAVADGNLTVRVILVIVMIFLYGHSFMFFMTAVLAFYKAAGSQGVRYITKKTFLVLCCPCVAPIFICILFCSDTTGLPLGK